MTDVEKRNIETLHQILHKIVFASQVSNISMLRGEVKDLNEVELTILSFVNNKPDIVLKEISSMFRMPPSTLTSALDRLERKDYLHRVISKRDRRSYGLEITQKGKDIVEEHMRQERESISAILAKLDSPEEQSMFLTMLTKIIDKSFTEIDFTEMMKHVKPLYE